MNGSERTRLPKIICIKGMATPDANEAAVAASNKTWSVLPPKARMRAKFLTGTFGCSSFVWSLSFFGSGDGIVSGLRSSSISSVEFDTTRLVAASAGLSVIVKSKKIKHREQDGPTLHLRGLQDQEESVPTYLKTSIKAAAGHDDGVNSATTSFRQLRRLGKQFGCLVAIRRQE